MKGEMQSNCKNVKIQKYKSTKIQKYKNTKIQNQKSKMINLFVVGCFIEEGRE
jgi:hypothetical protein